LDKSVVVATGIHDSNASLLPYLAKNSGQDFILNSTGTWCVSMHPSQNGDKEAICRDEDIGKVVFFNRSALDFPVKTSIFLGGMELDFYARLFRKANGKNDDFFPSSDMESARKILSEKRAFVMPELVKGSGQFPDFESGIWQDGTFYKKDELERMERLPPIVHDEKLFWAAVVVSAVIQSETAFRRAGLSDGTWIFTEGGFRKNRLYNSLLASVLGKNRVCTTSLKEATALGAAMTALMAGEGKSLSDFESLIDIEKNTVSRENAGDYETYKKEWILKGALKENESN
jgi:sugar (pentulose or hexulose) kinase